MGAAVGNKEESRTDLKLAYTPRSRASPVERAVAYPDYFRLKERLADLEGRLKTGKKELPQPRPPRDSVEDLALSPIKPIPKCSSSNPSDIRIIRHGTIKPISGRTSPKPPPQASISTRKLASSTSPKGHSQLQQASTHLFDFATRLIDEKEKFLCHKKSEEMRILRAKEELIREQLSVTRRGGRLGSSVPVTPTQEGRGDDVEELISEAELRVNLMNAESGVSFLKGEQSEVSKESNCFPNLSSIRHAPSKPCGKLAKKRTLSTPDIVHVDLSSASKLRSHREKLTYKPSPTSHKRPPNSPSSKAPEVKDLLILLQDSSIEDTPHRQR